MRKIILVILVSFIVITMLGMVITATQGNGQGNQSQGNQTNQTDMGSQVNKTKVRTNITTFIPWQKRNESECPEGCSCQGAVVSCPTATGKIMTIQAGASGKTIIIEINKTKVETELNITGEVENNKTKLKIYHGNVGVEIKVMPDTAAQKAIEILGLKVCNESNNCTIVLKDVSDIKGAVKPAYEVKAKKRVIFLWIFKWNKTVRAEVDAITGEAKKK